MFAVCVLYVVSLVTFTAVLGWTIRGSLNLLKDKYVQNVVGAFLDESRQLLQVVTSLIY